MKYAAAFSSIRTLVTVSVLTAFLGQTVAFATPVALSTPKTGKQAIAVIRAAESRPVSGYFAKGGTPEEIKALDKDLLTLAAANALVGIADDLDKFQPWWASHQTSMILKRDQVRAKDLQSFFTETFIVFKAEETQAQKDPSSFMRWLSDRVTSPFVRTVASGSFTILAGVFTFATGVIYGSVIAGPVASSVGALLDPVVRPIKEKMAVVGSRWLGPTGIWLNNRLFKGSGDEAAVEAQTSLEKEVGAVRGSQAKARELLGAMGHDMAPADFAANIERMHEIWNEMTQTWAKTNPTSFKDGRSFINDAMAFRPFNFSQQVMQSLTSSETFRQGIEQTVDRIVLRTGADGRAIDTAVAKLLTAVDASEQSTIADPLKAVSDLKDAKDAILGFGATEEQVTRIITGRQRELIFAKHTAAALAANIVHDFQYEEFNRSLPDVVRDAQQALRSNYCLDFFHKEFKTEVAKILQTMDFRIDMMTKTVAEAARQPNSPRRLFSLARARAAKAQPSSSEATSAPPAAPVAEPKTASTKAPLAQRLHARTTSVLQRLNGLRPNRVAVERGADPRGADPRHADDARTLRERAAEAVRGVRK